MLPLIKFNVPATTAQKEDNRAKSIQAVKKWREADQEFKRICKEKNIVVSEMVC